VKFPQPKRGSAAPAPFGIRHRWRLLHAVLAATALLPPPSALGHEAMGLLDGGGEEQVFAASRYAQTIADTPASVSLITQADMQRYGYRTVFDALMAQPGFYDASSQWPGIGFRGVALPGDFNSRGLVLVNGMPLYEPTYGNFFLEHLDLASIDHIEVVRGPGSALYGSGAVMGLINLVTRNGHQRPGAVASFEAGSHDSYKAYASYGATTDSGQDLFLSASAASSRGADVYLREYDTPAYANGQYHGISAGNGGSESYHLFGRLLSGDAWLQWMFADGRKHDPLASYGTVFNTDRLLLRETQNALEAGSTFTLASGAIATVRAYLIDTQERGDYPYNNSVPQAPAIPTYINVSDLGSTQYGAEFRYDRNFGPHRLLMGIEAKQVDARHQVGDQPGLARSGFLTVDSKPAYGQYSLFAQGQYRLDPDSQVFLGARYDLYRSFSHGVNSHLSPRLAYVRRFSGGGTGKLLYGEAYRAPTIYESLYQDGLPRAQIRAGPEGFRPEITRTLEALWESAPGRRFSWSASAYLTQLKNYPRLADTPSFNGYACVFQCNQYQNSDETAQVVGLESSLKWHGESELSGYASATLQRGTHGSPDKGETPATPKLLLKGGIHAPMPWGYWKGALETQFVGRTSGHLNTDGTAHPATPAYLLVNAHLYSDRLADGWRLSLRAQNLFDRRYYTVASPELSPLYLIPGPGRIFSLQLEKKF